MRWSCIRLPRPVQFELTAPPMFAVSTWIGVANLRPEHICSPVVWRDRLMYLPTITSGSCISGLPPSASLRWYMARTRCDGPRRQIYKRTKNLRAVQLLLGHTRLESTVQYLGIKIDDALGVLEQTEISGTGDVGRS